MLKMLSWNVNGLRACLTKGFMDFFNAEDADIVCLQECKLQPGALELELPGYYQFYDFAEKKGYSGTAIFTKRAPERVSYGLGIEAHDHEGRVITAEFPEFTLCNIYTPNAQRGLLRLDYRMAWEGDMRAYLSGIAGARPLVFCGDLNVAHTKMDIKNAASNVKNAGFTPEERAQFTLLLAEGFVDTFRHMNPEVTDGYSWWSYYGDARARNVGWRIDYFCVSAPLVDRIERAVIRPEVFGSDHCPVELRLKV